MSIEMKLIAGYKVYKSDLVDDNGGITKLGSRLGVSKKEYPWNQVVECDKVETEFPDLELFLPGDSADYFLARYGIIGISLHVTYCHSRGITFVDTDWVADIEEESKEQLEGNLSIRDLRDTFEVDRPFVYEVAICLPG